MGILYISGAVLCFIGLWLLFQENAKLGFIGAIIIVVGIILILRNNFIKNN